MLVGCYLLFCVFLLIKKQAFLAHTSKQISWNNSRIHRNQRSYTSPQNEQLNGTRKGLRISVLIFLGVLNIRCQQLGRRKCGSLQPYKWWNCLFDLLLVDGWRPWQKQILAGPTKSNPTNNEVIPLFLFLMKELHPWKSKWNPKKWRNWKMKFHFNWVIFRFHVSFRGCMNHLCPTILISVCVFVLSRPFASDIHRCNFHLLHRMDNVHCSSAFLPSNDLVEQKNILR